MKKPSVHLDSCSTSINTPLYVAKKNSVATQQEKKEVPYHQARKHYPRIKVNRAAFETLFIALGVLFLGHDLALTVDRAVTPGTNNSRGGPGLGKADVRCSTSDRNKPAGDKICKGCRLTGFAPHFGYNYLYFNSQVELVQSIHQFITKQQGFLDRGLYEDNKRIS